MSSNTEDFNADELQAPEWMNDDFFLKVLTSCEGKGTKIKVRSAKISPASMKGDHYASVIFRAQLDYELEGVHKSKSLIMKTMPENDGHKNEMLGKTDIFEKEIIMYTEVLPRFEKILRAVGDDTVLKAPCLYHALKPKKIIVFEDLVPKGYEVVRGRPLNVDEVKAAYAKLAKWHAISYKINLEEPHYFDKFERGLLSMSNIAEERFVTDGITNFVNMLRQTPSLHEYLPYFEALEPKLLEKCRASFVEFREAPQPNSQYVLCHGDFHSKNMMFKHNKETGALVDVLLLDFQIGYVGPIVHDLIYSLYCILDANLRLQFPAFLYSYFTNFIDTLKKIGFKGPLPTITQLHAQHRRHKCFEFFLLTTFLPMWFALEEKTEVEAMLTSEEFRRNMYKLKGYVEYLEEHLPRFLHLGYFDD
ncbi:uncharacterized protein LOC128863379 [Anastrepha ludens]|uniref:uncharacterized protein LOC128863379 n=1 Tax=Anastrepha ludens TaxID=28586 RepID=UPI0023B01930|nr:uncharacterized protein LOC128863379 [Anastrepha ludens]